MATGARLDPQGDKGLPVPWSGGGLEGPRPRRVYPVRLRVSEVLNSLVYFSWSFRKFPPKWALRWADLAVDVARALDSAPIPLRFYLNACELLAQFCPAFFSRFTLGHPSPGTLLAETLEAKAQPQLSAT